MTLFPLRFALRSLARASSSALRLALVCALLGFSLGSSAKAANFVVANLNDTGAGSLRQVITDANASSGADNVSFDTGVVGTIGLQSALPALDSDITLSGPGANVLRVQRSAGGLYRIFTVAGTRSVSISGLSIQNGDANGAGGGGILNAGTLTLTNCTLSNNTAGAGGGLFSVGTLTMTGCTFSNNTAGDGAGFYQQGSADLTSTSSTVRLSTFSGNTAAGSGGGIYNARGLLAIESCTIAQNTAPFGNGSGLFSLNNATTRVLLQNSILAANANSDVALSGASTNFLSQGFNLLGLGAAFSNGNQASDRSGVTSAQANLGALRDNGGPTPTIALLGGSLALDTGSASGNDQRGVVRPIDLGSVPNAAGSNASDIGAFESQDPEQSSASLVVNTLADSTDGICGVNNCSLRDAITEANRATDADTITFAAGLNGIIQLSAALPNLSTNISLQGPGANVLTVRRNLGVYRIIFVQSGATVSISGLTISNGSLGFGAGAGVCNLGALTLLNCTIRDNIADDGAGIYNVGSSLLVVGCAIINNSAGQSGGGIRSASSAGLGATPPTIRNCTISGNSALTWGGGIYSASGPLLIESSTISGNTAPQNQGSGLSGFNDPQTSTTLKNSIVAGNTNSDVNFQTNSPGTPNNFISQGFNLIGLGETFNNGLQTGDRSNVSGAQINLGPLQVNAPGTTPTRALQPGSIAIDAGNATGTDGRGVARPSDIPGVANASGGNGADIGAYEARVPTVDLDASTSGANFAASFAEGSVPVAIANTNAVVTSGESATLAALTVTLSSAPDGAAEVLAASAGNTGLSVNYQAANRQLSISGNASVAAYAQVLRTVTYSNSSQNPTPGARTILVEAINGPVISAPAISAITVSAVNDAPVNSVPGAQSTSEDTPLVFSAVNGNALSVSDAESSSFNITLSATNGTLSLGQTTGLSFTRGDGADDGAMDFSGSQSSINAALEGLAFTPATNASGGASVILTTGDGGNTGTGGEQFDTDTIAVTIAPVNDAPVAVDDSVSTQENTGVLVDVLANDFDVDNGALSIASVSAGPDTRGTLAIENGQVRFTPQANFNGTSTFGYTVSDGALTASATVSVVVRAVNSAPVARDDSYSVSGPNSLTVAAPGVLGNDFDVEGDALSATVVSQPLNGTLSLSANGSFVYTPEPGYSGSDSFSYRASDGTLLSNVATVTLSVTTAAPQSLSLKLSASTVRDGRGITGTITLARAADQDVVISLESSAPGVASVPAQVLVRAGEASVSFPILATRNVLATGSQTVVIRASALGLNTDAATLLVTDADVAQLSILVSPPFFNENFGPTAAVATISRNTPTDRPLVVRLISSNSGILRLPPLVVIPAGARSATVFVSAVDNRVVDPVRSVRLTARAAGLADGSVLVRVGDNGRVTQNLALSLEDNGLYAEQVGGRTARGRVTLSGTPLLRPIVITIVSSDPSRISVPGALLLPAGQRSIEFPFVILDNSAADGAHRVILTARSPGLSTSATQAIVLDNDGPSLSVSLLRSSVLENAGSFTATVSRRNTSLSAPLVVSLASSDRTRAVVPAAITIPAGRASVAFTVRLVDNRAQEGTRRVVISASRAGLLAGSAPLDVLDDESAGA